MPSSLAGNDAILSAGIERTSTGIEPNGVDELDAAIKFVLLLVRFISNIELL